MPGEGARTGKFINEKKVFGDPDVKVYKEIMAY
jgi:hypothetical protein